MNPWRGVAVALLVAGAAQAAMVEREVAYQAGETPMKGYLAYDDAAAGPQPGVFVVHEAWGLDEYARGRARQLAECGYVAFAIDMYGEGRRADHPDAARAFADEIRRNVPLGEERFRAAGEFLKAQPQVDASRLAAIGYCFGGTVALNMARAGEDLKAVASFHGGLRTEAPARSGGVKARVLVCHGGADALVSTEDVAAFDEEMRQAGAWYKIIVYPGAPHSFTVPDANERAAQFGLPIGYDAEADRLSWGELKAHLRDAFGEP